MEFFISDDVRYPVSYSDLTHIVTLFRNDTFHYGNRYMDIITLLMEHNAPVPPSLDFKTMSGDFFTVEFFEYLISNKFDIHTQDNILELSISWKKMDVVKLLLDNGVVSGFISE